VIYVITACCGVWDNLRAPLAPQTDGVRWLCFTDEPFIPAVAPWEFRPLPAHPGAARCSRIPKILPHLMLPDDAEYSIWHDANFQLRLAPRDIISELLKVHDWAAHIHPARDCVYKEAEILLREKIGTPALVEAQVARYRAQGYPTINGLWANGMIVRRHTPQVARVNELWWKLFAEGCERDQLSFPVARMAEGLTTERILNDIYSSPYVKFNWHAAWKNNQDNPSYWPQRDRLRMKSRHLSTVIGTVVPYPEY
jgi:alkaline ceramidase TOD1/glycosyltransferase MUCI70-like protein